jgi:hypothetical protein
MPPDKEKRAKHHYRLIYRRHLHFDVTPYVDNPHMIKNLHESHVDALAAATDLEEQLIDAKKQIEALMLLQHQMELHNKELGLKCEDFSRKLEVQENLKNEILEKCKGLEIQLDTLRSDKHEMELQKQNLEIRLATANHRLIEASKWWRTFPQYLVTIVATGLLSFGINMLTASSSNTSTGWILVASGGFLEIIAFFITLSTRAERNI